MFLDKADEWVGRGGGVPDLPRDELAEYGAVVPGAPRPCVHGAGGGWRREDGGHKEGGGRA